MMGGIMGGLGLGGFGAYGMLFAMLFNLLFLAGLIILIMWGAGQLTRSTVLARSADVDSPLETLKVRYARGEITTAEYNRIRSELA